MAYKSMTFGKQVSGHVKGTLQTGRGIVAIAIDAVAAAVPHLYLDLVYPVYGDGTTAERYCPDGLVAAVDALTIVGIMVLVYGIARYVRSLPARSGEE